MTPDDELDRLTRLARRVFDVPMVSIALHSPRGRTGGPVDHDVFQRATLDSAAVVLVPDARADPRFARHRSVVGASSVRFFAGRRLLDDDGRPVGVLSLRDTRIRLLSDAHLLLLDEIAGWVEQEIGRAASRSAATRVHADLLPRCAPSLPGYDLAAASVLAGGQGAGFFDWYPARDAGTPTAVGWSVVDVMGSPAATAVVAAGLRGALRAHGTPDRDDPAATLASAADVVAADLAATSTFATLIAGRLTTDGEISVADAGHGLALLARADGTTEHLATHALPLGIGDRPSWTSWTRRLAPGDSLVVFTEGLLGLYDGTLASLGHVETLVRGADRAHDVLDRVRALARRRGSAADVTVLVLRRR
ncbi:SpoIIE family protein phosphatase [Nakamurella flavida]|uniref:SpoIIE family protein phosphatase n=1 Tax=Nakamurella flavida TaxID=363630 RepID=A0A938YH18_9ACTN|nr:SpoIIE family protein phosphatase [Nakamurella flavida]MBM9474924.1 SpoIIE family protein phosphatase [Nakamurella flavida]MDP9776493.1 serine phosphatase RsbU (regulator of sigma subunit) [Nakamurella flavida]